MPVNRCPWCHQAVPLTKGRRYPLCDPKALRHVQNCMVLRLGNSSKPKGDDHAR